MVRNEDVIAHAGIEDAEFKAACYSELAEIERRRQLYLGNSERAEITGRTAIVIDDGVATGDDLRHPGSHRPVAGGIDNHVGSSAMAQIE